LTTITVIARCANTLGADRTRSRVVADTRTTVLAGNSITNGAASESGVLIVAVGSIGRA
jgi:hypothetical protein